MKRIFIICLLLFASAGQAADGNKDPEGLVRSFEKELAAFHTMAYPVADLPKEEPKIAAAWDAIRKKYFIPGFTGEPGAYISDTVVRRLEEKFAVKSAGETKAVVVLTVKERNSVLNTVATGDTEYHLILDAGRWYIENVYVFYKGKKYNLYE